MAEEYKRIVDTLFLKRYCIKSKKSSIPGSNRNDHVQASGESMDSWILPDPSLFDDSNQRVDIHPASFGDFGSDHNGNEFMNPSDMDRRSAEIWMKLHVLKETLNSTKNQLSDKDMQQWHDHTKSTNPAGDVVNELRRTLNPELCTQAWCKFYEILTLFPNLVRSRGRFRSLHICEAPGAFIAALNHYLQTKRLWIKQWDWRANSLNPYYEGNPYECMIGDDRLIFHTSKRWIFGADDTGDLKSPFMLDTLMRDFGDVDLVTADGSIDCQEDPNEQESQLFALHYAEVVCALHVLCKGGNFVLKRFTMFEKASVSLLYLLCCAFEEVNLFKPATSKSGNSELYIVCESYKGLSPTYSWKLRSPSNANGHDVDTVKEIPLSFLYIAYSAQEFFIDHQLSMVRFNLDTFRSWTPELQSQCNDARKAIADQFMIITGLAPIKESVPSTTIIIPLAGAANAGPIWLKSMPWQKRYGTYEQRRPDQPERPRYVLQNLSDELDVFRERLSIGGGLVFRTFIINGYSCPLSLTEWYNDNQSQPEPVFGQRLSSIANSKLCHGRLLMISRNAKELYESNGLDVLRRDSYELELLELCQFAKFESESNSKLLLSGIDQDQDCVWIDLTGRAVSKLDWLQFLITLISSNKPPQSLELTRSRLLILTRFSANILAVLCACYEQVTLIARNSPAGMCTIKAENYRPLPNGDAQSFVSYLHRVKYGLTKRERNVGKVHISIDLLQFLPMRYLSDPKFYKALQRFNNTVMLKICQETLQAITNGPQ